MEKLKNRNCVHPNSLHNNGEHEDTNEDDGAVEDDDNRDREQTRGLPKPDPLAFPHFHFKCAPHHSRKNVLKHWKRCLCELFECSESEDVWQQLTQKPMNFHHFEPAAPRKT